ncbi:MAG TPA: helix-turn-helix transcriptional regulator [Allosphingosinicella sp.]|nr:helix-turn-helix transcriptional regulator [Allosphingosinicella sp.]
MIRAGRIERKLTAEELAARAGISRALLYRIENGDPSCSIGAMFEAATIAGVPLFEDEQSKLTMRVNEVESRLTLLPKSIQKARAKASDDF